METAAPASSPPIDARRALYFAAGLAAVIAAYWYSWPAMTPDMHDFLVPWYEHIMAKGRIAAFASPFSNYTPPYLYLLSAVSLFDGAASPETLIKILSVAATALLALALNSLLKAAGVQRAAETSLLVFLLPTAVINAPFLGQCDAFWAAACVAAVAQALRRRPVAMLVWCGVAISLKAQAAFIAPFIIATLLAERADWKLWLIPPAVYAGMMTPAWLLGWPATDLAAVYLRQADYYTMAGNLANPWILVEHFLPGRRFGIAWLGYAAAAAATLIYIGYFGRRRLAPRAMIAAALLSSLMLPWFLPRMHERYFFLADMLAFALVIVGRDRQSLVIAVAVQAGSLLSLLSYIWHWPVPVIAGSFVTTLAMAALLQELLGARPAISADHVPSSSANSATAT